MTKGFRAAHDCARIGARVIGMRQPALRGSLHAQRRAVRCDLQRHISCRTAHAAAFMLTSPPSGNEGDNYSN